MDSKMSGFDWATASAEEKVRRRWPDVSFIEYSTSMVTVITVKPRSLSGWRSSLADAWEEASQHPSVLELQSRETSLPITPALVAAYVAAEGDFEVAEEVVGAWNNVAVEGLPALEVAEQDWKMAAWLRSCPKGVGEGRIVELLSNERQLRTALAELSLNRQKYINYRNEAVAEYARYEAELSALKESAGTGFEEWYSEEEKLYAQCTGPKVILDGLAMVRRRASVIAWNAALASRLDHQAIRREALQEALEVVKGERLSSHNKVGDGSLRPTETYSQAIRNAELAILAKIEEVK